MDKEFNVVMARSGWRSEAGGSVMKYAIVEDGGKQYKAIEGSVIDVDRFPAEAGEQIDLERVLLVVEDGEVAVGTPLVEGAKVQATVVSQVKGPKIVVFKYKPQVRYRVKQGHRQQYTRLMIDSITVG
jgi:large subunit ribosomal protein L21